ncbi:hypothetical protein [Caenispirillum bisanense]|uniref:Uncharacterized protein n=1 Tax=Caenispirillum bisanense TaxID=414052 RepID=A0A286GEH6_9PROT|nr:hypothetical protein [Caenispirillum bisanense]SOD93898.1 hypothetical protein SAMN05421508_103254 [Caenispirillum bisanense]
MSGTTHPYRQANAEAVNDRAKLLMHRLVARRLRDEPGLAARALEFVRATDGLAADAEWRALLSMDPATVRRKITERSADMTRLRISSPFGRVAGLGDPELRRRIWRKARRGLAHGD